MSGGPEFHRTPMGRTFYDATLPEIGRQLKRVADALVAHEQRAAVGALADEPPITADDVRDSFFRQLDTCPAGIRLKGMMDAREHNLLMEVVLQHARNLAQALDKG